MDKKTLKLALMGFGVAAKAFSRILIEKHDVILEDTGVDVIVSAIATGSSGCLVDPEGIDLNYALEIMEEQGCFQPGNRGYRKTDSMTIVKKADYDALLEMTPINIHSGQPAIDHLKIAMERGKHGITANKGPLAYAYRELRDLAKEKDVCFLFETTVLAGVPLFNMAESSLAYCKFTSARGILNVSSNYVLEEMGKGLPLDVILKNGRKEGFLEADPSMDLEGWDATVKLTTFMNVLMDADINPMQIDRTGITDITPEDVHNALMCGKKIKLICRGYFDEEGNPVGIVKPEMIRMDDAMAGSDVVASLRLQTDIMGEITITQHDTEPAQTGYGLFIDVVKVARTIGDA